MELGPVIVQGKKNPIAESDRRLKKIVEGLPGLGTDTPPTKDAVDNFLTYYRAHEDPNKLGILDQQMLLKMTGGNVDDARVER